MKGGQINISSAVRALIIEIAKNPVGRFYPPLHDGKDGNTDDDNEDPVDNVLHFESSRNRRVTPLLITDFAFP